MSQRLVKKPSLLSRLWQAPLDNWIRINEDFETLDWEGIQLALSFPVAFLLNVLYLLVKTSSKEMQFENLTPYTSFASLDEWFEEDSTFFNPTVFEGVLCAISFINAFYLFTRRKHYQLLSADPNQHPGAPSAQKATIDLSEQDGTTSGWIGSMIRSRRVSRHTSKKNIWEMFVWDPPTFSLNLFCWFSPPQLAILYGADRENWYFYCMAAASTGFFMHFVVRAFREMLRDKQVIMEQVYNEFNKNYVAPKMYVRKQDESIGTDPMPTDASLSMSDLRSSGNNRSHGLWSSSPLDRRTSKGSEFEPFTPENTTLATTNPFQSGSLSRKKRHL